MEEGRFVSFARMNCRISHRCKICIYSRNFGFDRDSTFFLLFFLFLQTNKNGLQSLSGVNWNETWPVTEILDRQLLKQRMKLRLEKHLIRFHGWLCPAPWFFGLRGENRDFLSNLRLAFPPSFPIRGNIIYPSSFFFFKNSISNVVWLKFASNRLIFALEAFFRNQQQQLHTILWMNLLKWNFTRELMFLLFFYVL